MVVIKDTEMPKSCLECRLTYPRWDFNIGCKVCNAIIGHHEEYGEYKTKRHSDCPLVEIITCKDCKYYREDDDAGHCTNHTYGDITFWCYDDYYCADAERRENETN